jgi:hypothetical protein
MTKFKPKTNKNIIVDKNSILTVDKKHQEILASIKKEEEDMENMKLQYNTLKLQYRNANEIEKKLQYKDQLCEIKKEIQRIQSLRKQYYLDNSKYIFNYFEHKKNIIENNNKKRVVNDFFRLNKDKRQHTIEETQEVQNNHKHYFAGLDESFINMEDYIEIYDQCKLCHAEMISVESEGIMVCTKCFTQSEYLVEHDKPSYKEPPKEVSFYAYKRINHFREIIAQFQAKESTNIDEEVIENIKKQIKKERISLDQLTNDKTKQILKNLGYNKYYEHISFIKEKLGIFPPRMTVELEQKLCNLFMEIQKPYSKYCPVDRVNFLNYYYVLYKLCELLREDKYLPYFYMLKDPEKRNEQDEIWKNICKDLQWEFIPTP